MHTLRRLIIPVLSCYQLRKLYHFSVSHALHNSYTCVSHALHNSYTCVSHALHNSYTCVSHALHSSYTCVSHALHNSYTCVSHALHNSYTCVHKRRESFQETEDSLLFCQCIMQYCVVLLFTL